MTGVKIKKVIALYDYTRTHNDELSFNKNDVITLTQQIDGGWWEGTLNQLTGWFPSNYVVEIGDDVDNLMTDGKANADTSLTNFQADIVNHILDGEKKYCTKLSNMLTNFITPLIQILNINESKIQKICDVLKNIIPIHREIIESLENMKSSGCYRVGRIYLDMASTINDTYCSYASLHLFVIYSLDMNKSAIMEYFVSQRLTFEWSQIKPQLSLVFDRLSRYPLLLKEMERYLEDGNADRGDIQRAIVVYGEINEKSTSIRKKKERDLDVLCATILGWRGERLNQLGDPLLTIKVSYTGSAVSDIPGALNHVLVVMPAFVILLACTEQGDVYAFKAKLPLEDLQLFVNKDPNNDEDANFEMRSELTGEFLKITCENAIICKELYTTIRDIQSQFLSSSLASASPSITTQNLSSTNPANILPQANRDRSHSRDNELQNQSSNQARLCCTEQQIALLRKLRPDPPSRPNIFEYSQLGDGVTTTMNATSSSTTNAGLSNDEQNVLLAATDNHPGSRNSTAATINTSINTNGTNAGNYHGHFSPKAARRKKEEETSRIKDDALVLQVIESYCVSNKGSHALDLARLRLSDAEIIRTSCDIRGGGGTVAPVITQHHNAGLPPMVQPSGGVVGGPGGGGTSDLARMQHQQPRDSSSSSNSGDVNKMQQHQQHHQIKSGSSKNAMPSQSHSNSKPIGCAPLISGKSKRK